MKSATEVLEAAKDIEEHWFFSEMSLSSEMIAFFADNEEEVQSLLTKIKTIKMDMIDRIDNLCGALKLSELEGQGREIKFFHVTPAYLLHDACEHYMYIDQFFCLVINTIITPKGWKFKVFARKYSDHPAEPNNQRVASWYAARGGPRTFPYKAEPILVAAQLRYLLKSAQTYSFPLPE